MNAEVEGLPLLRTGMAESLLQEVARLLERLAGSGETSAIDLRSLPMTEGDRNELAERLGSGEVRILFDVAGTSEAWETAYAGVWWVRHLDVAGRVAAERIEIAPLPEMLEADAADIAVSARQIRDETAVEAQERNPAHV